MSITVGDFPPNSSVTEAKCLAAADITILPTLGEPVKKIWLKGNCNNCVEASTSPSNNATSSSEKTFATISAIKAEEFGVISEGFIITALPAAMADTNGPKVKLNGKFHGDIIKQTPLGS